MTWDSRYRMLAKDETILPGDEVLTDSHLGWRPVEHTLGQLAPDPLYTAHRMYRRAAAPLPAQPEEPATAEEAAARISELEAALRSARFAIEATEACLNTWNDGRGSPANVDGILAEIDTLLAGGKRDG